MAFAEIVNYGADYPPLGIRRGFNCLFLYDHDAPKAVMVPVDRDEVCLRPANADEVLANGKGTQLFVRRSTNPNYHEADYPSVTRWDWDARRNHQYIGIKCGDGWCEVGEPGFTPSPGHRAGGVTGTAGRVIEIKGWYDEQRLAVVDASGKLVPSRVTGTVFPDPTLDAISESQFTNTWRRVAWVELTGALPAYERKLNLGMPPDSAKNSLFLCKGTKADCLGAHAAEVQPCPALEPMATTGKWWMRIELGGIKRYMCVDRWDLPTSTPSYFHLIGTTRWRWLLKDETIWEACPSGCCHPHTQ